MEATARWRGQKSWWSNKRRRMGKIFVLFCLFVCIMQFTLRRFTLEPQTCPHDTLSFNSKSISICIILIVVKDCLHLGVTFVAAKYVAEVPQRKRGWAKEQSGHREQDTGLAAAIRRIQVQPLRQNGWDCIHCGCCCFVFFQTRFSSTWWDTYVCPVFHARVMLGVCRRRRHRHGGVRICVVRLRCVLQGCQDLLPAVFKCG